MRRSIRNYGAALTFLVGLMVSAMLPARVQAGSMTFTATSDGFAESPNGNNDYTSLTASPNNDLAIEQFSGIVQDVALLTFDLSSLPTNATITGVSFKFYESVAGSSSSPSVGTIVAIDGFATANKSVTLGDATVGATQVGQYDNAVLGTGVHSVSLSSSPLLGLVGSGGLVGLRLQGTKDGVNTAIYSVESGQVPPQLVVTFSVPEPSTAVLLGTSAVVGLFGLARRRRSTR